LPTGLGEARNLLIVMAAESVIAIGRGWGTLSEIALARRLDRNVFALDTWDVEGLEKVETAAEAVKRAIGD
jgi:cyclopropane fatty-acyl-phospholipid synthase-like methyltransferase